MVSRREFILGTVGGSALLLASGVRWRLRGAANGPDVDMVIQKNPGCMCCDRWASHLNDHGITTRVEEHADLAAYKDAMNVPDDLRSCHTGLIGDYIVEGHVPADDVLRMLEEQAPIRGISVPGMPIGSPGMESGERVDSYDVVAFGTSTGTYVFAEHPA
jgi:hypothetical protein